jgi:ATP-dependent Clp protease ATP-binding subunit ClpB
VFFKPLTKDEIGKIVRLLAQELTRRLQEKQLALVLSDEAVQKIIDSGYDPIYGARPLKRYMQHTLETTLAKRILSGDLNAGDTLTVTIENGELTVKKS